MNQEKIMKARMITAYIVCGFAVIGMCIFIALFVHETHETQRAYRQQYNENLRYASEEINIYLEKKIDYELHYNMILSDIGSARNFIFLIKDVSTERKNLINEFHYCFVKYPKQMSEKLEESAAAMEDIADNLDKGYDEVREIIDSIEKKGN